MPQSRRTDGISPELLRQARRRTRDQLGTDVEGKATDEFCMAFGIPPGGALAEAAGAGGFAEAMRRPGAGAPAVLEMAADGEPPELPANVEAALATTVRESVGGALDDLSHAETAMALLVRQARVKAAREEFLRRAGLIRDAVEHATSALQRAAPGRGRVPESDRLLVEVCWLNRTMRTVDARSASGVASDPAVERVDVPRRLEPEQVALDVMLEAAAAVRAQHGLSGAGVTVAVIDSEAALGHPALRDRVIHRRNFTQEPWGTPDSHGTAVAGIIGASGAEHDGMAPGATIYNYKVLATHRAFNATDFEGALAIQQALEDGARVANCSWGAGPATDGSSREARACDRAWRFGLTVVKSAGNQGPGARTLTTPADADGVVVVGATGSAARANAAFAASMSAASGSSPASSTTTSSRFDDSAASTWAARSGVIFARASIGGSTIESGPGTRPDRGSPEGRPGLRSSVCGVPVDDNRPLSLTVGCALGFETPQPVSAVLQVAPSARDVQVRAERWDTDAEHHGYVDLYGNRCERLAIGAGASRLVYEAEVLLSSSGDRLAPGTPETPVTALPDELIAFVMPSRFCLPDELGHEAWQRFGGLAPGWERVQAIVDFAHGHLEWVAGASNPWTTAVDAYRAGQGVCRDFAHLAITFCRALNIPARYVCGYIPDIDVPPPAEPMDFAAWFEAYLDGDWHTFDARNNRHRVGRVVVGRGRDAVDVAVLTSFGPVTLTEFEVRAA